MPAPISIIIPTLNSETDLYRTLGSLFEGIENNLIRELIISDGGSTDKTKLIADELGAVVVEGSCGRGLQISKGIDKSKGDWILILHADTSLSLDWSVKLLEKIDKNFAYHFKLKFKSKSLFARILEYCPLRFRSCMFQILCEHLVFAAAFAFLHFFTGLLIYWSVASSPSHSAISAMLGTLAHTRSAAPRSPACIL